MLGAITGDVIGSVYEHDNYRGMDFPLFGPYSTFTDDSVLTVATAEVLLNKGDYTEAYRRFGRRYPDAGYGGMFNNWLHQQDSQPYDSFGNGSAMRVAPVGWAFKTLDEVLAEAERSAKVTHNHPEGIKGAQVTAAAVFAARTGTSREKIRELVEKLSDYDLDRTVDGIRKSYRFDVTCQGTVPEAVIVFLESTDFEDAIRKAISLGGDSDTLACITGGIAEAFYGGVPVSITTTILDRLNPHLRQTVKEFDQRFMNSRYTRRFDRVTNSGQC